MKEEGILERLEQRRVTEKVEKARKSERSHAFTRSIKTAPSESVCGSEKHKGKIFFCKKFKELKLAEKKVILRKLGLCKKCLGFNEDDHKCRDLYLCKSKACKGEASADHHNLICPRWEIKSESTSENEKRETD